MEAEKTRNSINGAVNGLKKFMEEVGETSRRLGTQMNGDRCYKMGPFRFLWLILNMCISRA
jgi:hypothetical protein